MEDLKKHLTAFRSQAKTSSTKEKLKPLAFRGTAIIDTLLDVIEATCTDTTHAEHGLNLVRSLFQDAANAVANKVSLIICIDVGSR